MTTLTTFNNSSSQESSSRTAEKHRFKVPAAHTQSRLAPLDPENPTVVSYQGLLNLTILLFIAGDANLLLENVRKYGIRLTSSHYFPSYLDSLVLGLGILVPCMCTAFSYNYERKNSTLQRLPSLWPHLLSLSLMIFVPSLLGYFVIENAGFSAMMMLLAATQLLKVWSWVMTNRDLHAAQIHGQDTPYYAASDKHLAYPVNLTAENLFYFMAVPTFCYQPYYPRTESIRWRVVFSLVWRLALALAFLLFITEQYSLPTLENSLHAFDKDGGIYPTVFLERVLKLAASAVPLFLTMFYALFHCHLNLMAELTRFADREFYQAWWNCETLADAWRKWNIPVHDFCKRHIYIPLRRKFNIPPLGGQLIVFTFSAVMHEFLVAIPAKRFLGSAFVGFLLQVPLIAFTELLKSKDEERTGAWRGNVVVWLVFIVVGWPALALTYYNAWATQ